MPDITFRSKNDNSAESSTTVVVTKPSGTVSGDVLVAAFASDIGNHTLPTGFTKELEFDVEGTNDFTFSIGTKLAGGSEPANYTFTTSNSSNIAAALLAYTNVDNTTLVDVKGTGQGNAETSSTSVTALSATTVTANAMVISFHFTRTARSFTPPSGMTERVDINDQKGLAVCEVLQASAGATGNKTATASSADHWGAVLLALRPLAVSTSRSPSGGISYGGRGY